MTTTLPSPMLEEFLLCKLCFERFKDPKILPQCLHTFCKSCLERYITRTTTSKANMWFLCPQCRVIVELQPNGIQKLECNEFVSNLEKIYSPLYTTDNSPEKPIGEEVFECDGTKQKDSWKRDIKRTRQCICSCQQKNVEFFCSECQDLSCYLCINLYHADHNVEDLEKIGSKERDFLDSVVHRTKKHVTELSHTLESSEKYDQKLKRSRKDIIDEIRQKAKVIRQEIMEVEDHLIDEINSVCDDEFEKLNKEIGCNKKQIMLLRALVDFSEKLLTMGSSPEILGWRSQLDTLLLSTIGQGQNHNSLANNPLLLQYDDETSHSLNFKGILGFFRFQRYYDPIQEDKEGEKILMKKSSNTLPNDRGQNETACLPQTADGIKECQILKANLVKKFSSDKVSLLKTFSSFTDMSRYPPFPTAMTVTSKGDLILVDRQNKCVKFFCASGGMYKKIGCSDAVWGVTSLSEGQIAIADRTIHIFDDKGKIIKVFRQQPRNSHGIAKSASGDLVVSDLTSKSIYILSYKSGIIKRMITQRGKHLFKCPQYVAVNQSDDIIVSDCEAHCISIFNNKGELLHEYGTGEAGNQEGELNCPQGVCVDAFGNILICDKLNDRIILLDQTGTFLCNLSNKDKNVQHPQTITINKEGQMIIAEEDGRIKVFSYFK